jgi:hypothetical protein
MHRVVEVANVDGPHKHTDPRNNLAQLVTKLLNLDLQGCLAVLGLADVRANLTFEDQMTSRIAKVNEPMAVLGPVKTTTPRAFPAATLVP